MFINSRIKFQIKTQMIKYFKMVKYFKILDTLETHKSTKINNNNFRELIINFKINLFSRPNKITKNLGNLSVKKLLPHKYPKKTLFCPIMSKQHSY
jgi:hypothetical protein